LKSLSTEAKTLAYINKIQSSNAYSYTRATYIDDSGDEVIFNKDIAWPLTIKKEGRTPRYANINYEPAAGECSFEVVNRDKEYSPRNTTSSKSGVFVRDREIRFYDGKRLENETDTESEPISIATTDAISYFTQENSGTIELDVANTAATSDIFFNGLFTAYDSVNYDAGTYSPEGYYIMQVDRTFIGAEIWNSIDVIANSTGIDVYIAYGNDLTGFYQTGTGTDWILLGSTTNGSTTFNLGGVSNATQFAVAFVFNTGDWSSGAQVSLVTLNYETTIEWVLMGTFLLDDPEFFDKPSPEISTIKCSGRNSWKRAIDSKINIADLSSGVTLDQLIKDVCDQVNITYTGTSIADLSSFGDRTLSTGYDDEVPPLDIFSNILQIIGREYRMRIDDSNILFVEPRPTNFDVDFVFDYRNYIQAKQKRFSDRQIKRITFLTDNQVIDPAEQLDSDTFVSVTNGSLSWGSGAIAKYYTFTVNSGDIAITGVELNNTSADFTFIGSGSITITLFGSPFRSTEPTYYGEAVNHDNLTNEDGLTFREVNPLLISDAEAKTVSENFVAEFGTPEFNIRLTDSFVNALVEVNDQALVVSEDLVDTNLYEVLSIEHDISSETSKQSKYELVDTGRDITEQGDFIYDRNLYFIGANFTYDSGLIYDASFPIGVTASEILAQRDYFTDKDFT
jgi:hypothetical protein